MEGNGEGKELGMEQNGEGNGMGKGGGVKRASSMKRKKEGACLY